MREGRSCTCCPTCWDRWRRSSRARSSSRRDGCRSTWRLFRDSLGVLMEGVPSHLDYAAIGRSLSELAGVTSVHDLHVWHMSADTVALSAHLALVDGARWLEVLAS